MLHRMVLISTLFSLSQAVYAEPPPIRIGVIGPFSAKSSSDMGESLRGGARVFLSDLNQMGGVLGRKIELIERDDEAKPELGVALAKKMIAEDKVVAVVGFANTGVALQAAKVFQEAKIPLIVTVATGAKLSEQFMPPAIHDSYIFRLAASDKLQPVAILSDVIDKRKLTQIAILHDDSPYGQFGKDSLLAEMKTRKLAPVAVESVKIGETDMQKQVASAKAAGAQIIILYCLPNEAIAIANSVSRAHLNIPLAGSWVLSQHTFAEQAGGNAEGVRMPITFIENESTRSNGFVLSYLRINKVKHIPSAVSAAQTYDALRILSLAIMQANSTVPSEIKAALENMKYEATSTIVTRYKKPFSSSDHEAITQNMLFMGEVRHGKVSYAYKEDASSSLISRTR
ncbi:MULTISPECIES: ABC transporter substrate-binding protein [unclassified Undibacterium]|uniref:ABC transporter substrate-binding protein n=1 Tax=unclassified Undibacterium TaxID=2630295 RepID=UPI002AC981E0|nr:MULTISPECIES: ABC transporter substrate-binding protein [unclassified Undibacterium]MEB0138974.1 ABC transporter substrate-binding protein [Undibacterium sp. CCC2.1]MEB0171931.1 ABC transporter substrate-binding protein [Undibacterium sp. CCC1.1]MEB0175872.1 ABC transporter substrate-binding protein [Undibacterium sp. CCC3.4]MEB0215062.1 ABC transporter substrate-binding protein [Undibacterium sp. 5I2]WPX45034.1 ABC transporter substrate-binding protein [Undibacterium sp. CCC3.4]